MDSRDYLGIYLNDHLAASTAAVELLDRAIGAEDGDLERFLSDLRAEIQADRDTLKATMRANSVRIRRAKLVAAWLAEKPSRLKFNGHLLRRSPLTPLVELETLAVGIWGKELLWRALRGRAADEDAAGRFDVLIERAVRQRADVDRQRTALAERVFPPATA